MRLLLPGPRYAVPPEPRPGLDPAAAASAGDRSDRPPSDLAVLLMDVLGRMPAHADELRDLDAALGDGDLGVTVATGSQAAAESIAGDPSVPDDELVRRAATAFASANPSTFAALVGGAVVAASRTLADGPVEFARAVADRIAARGGAARGDKTVLDAIYASVDANGSLDDRIAAVEAVVRESTEWVSARGRAAWLRERSAGRQDPGMTAYLDFLIELRNGHQSHPGNIWPDVH